MALTRGRIDEIKEFHDLTDDGKVYGVSKGAAGLQTSAAISATEFGASAHKIYVDYNYTGATINGSLLYPYKTLQAAINANANGNTSIFVVKTGSAVIEAITIPEALTNSNIVAENDVEGQFRITISNNVTILGTEIGLRGFEITGTLKIGTGGNTVAYIENCAVEGAIVSNTAKWAELKDCEAMGDIINTAGTLYIKGGDSENNKQIGIYGGAVIANDTVNINVVNNGGKFYCQNCSFIVPSGSTYAYSVPTGISGAVSLLASGTTIKQSDGSYAPISILAGNYAIGNSFDYQQRDSDFSGATEISSGLFPYQLQLLDSDGTHPLPGGTSIYGKSEIDELIAAAGNTGTIGVYDYGKVLTATANPATPAAGATLFDFQANQLFTYDLTNTTWVATGSPLVPAETNRIDILEWLDGNSATGVSMTGLDGFSIYFNGTWKYFCDANSNIAFGSTIKTNLDGSKDVADIVTPDNIPEDSTKFEVSTTLGVFNFIQKVISKINSFVTSISTLTSDLQDKQNTLVSGTNIKTVNGINILGSGDAAIEAPYTVYYDMTQQLNYEKWIRLATLRTTEVPAGWSQLLIIFNLSITSRQLVPVGGGANIDINAILKDIIVKQKGWESIGYQGGNHGSWDNAKAAYNDNPDVDNINLFFGSYKDNETGKWCVEIWSCNKKNQTADANIYTVKLTGAEMISNGVNNYSDISHEYYGTAPLVLDATPAGTGRFAVADNGTEMWTEIVKN